LPLRGGGDTPSTGHAAAKSTKESIGRKERAVTPVLRHLERVVFKKKERTRTMKALCECRRRLLTADCFETNKKGAGGGEFGKEKKKFFDIREATIGTVRGGGKAGVRGESVDKIVLGKKRSERGKEGSDLIRGEKSSGKNESKVREEKKSREGTSRKEKGIQHGEIITGSPPSRKRGGIRVKAKQKKSRLFAKKKRPTIFP